MPVAVNVEEEPEMKKKLIGSVILLAFACLASPKAGHACNYGGVTCNTVIGVMCNGTCESDVCVGTQIREVLCSNGTIQFQDE